MQELSDSAAKDGRFEDGFRFEARVAVLQHVRTLNRSSIKLLNSGLNVAVIVVGLEYVEAVSGSNHQGCRLAIPVLWQLTGA